MNLFLKRAVLIGSLLILILTASGCSSNTVYVYDFAKVLNRSQVQNEAETLSYPIAIYTTQNYHGTKDGFVEDTVGRVNSPNLIIFADDVLHGYLAIVAGSNVHLSEAASNDAKNAFIQNFKNTHDHTSAINAAIDSLKNNLNTQMPTALIWFGIAIILFIILILFIIVKRRRFQVLGKNNNPLIESLTNNNTENTKNQSLTNTNIESLTNANVEKGNIEDENLTNANVKNESLTNADVENESLTNANIENNTLMNIE